MQKSASVVDAGDTCVAPNTKKRKYRSSFLELGFTSVAENGREKPRCLICDTVLCAESMKPSKLRRHFETLHKEFQGKPLSFFQKRLDQFESQGAKLARLSHTSDAALRASFATVVQVVYFIIQI